MVAALLFDLDGTLVDTAPDIHAAANAALADLRMPPTSLEDARSYIGDGMPRFIKRLLTRQWWGEPPTPLFERAVVLMQQYYARECTRHLRVYPDVASVLTQLGKRFKMACVTNKPVQFTEPLLAACGLLDFFPVLVCGDTLSEKKPAPAPLLHACATLAVDVKEAVMVGDSITDSRAAEAAGCRFIVVSYGYHRNGSLPPADVVIDSFRQLPEHL